VGAWLAGGDPPTNSVAEALHWAMLDGLAAVATAVGVLYVAVTGWLNGRRQKRTAVDAAHVRSDAEAIRAHLGIPAGDTRHEPKESPRMPGRHEHPPGGGGET
jgi:hypothetical protein